MEDRQEILILDKGGVIVYHQNNDGALNEQDGHLIVTASYLTAILQFAQAATSGSIISSFEMGKSKVFLKVGDSIPLYYVFIIGSKVSLKEKKIQSRLEHLQKEFENRYSLYDLEDWDGSTNYFASFQNSIKSILRF